MDSNSIQEQTETKEKLESSSVSISPDANETSVADALSEAKGDFDAAVEYMMESKKRKHSHDEEKEEKKEEGDGNFPLSLLQDETSSESSFSEFTPGTKSPFETNIEAIPLECGVLLFKNVVPPDQQIRIFERCCELSDPSIFAHFSTNEYKQATPAQLMSLNWLGALRKKELPQELAQFANSTFQKGYEAYKNNEKFNNTKLPKELQCPSSYKADALNVLMFPECGKMHLHQDAVGGWVLAVSIGNSSIFTFSYDKKPENLHKIQVDSGDAVLINAHKIYHSVVQILPNTAPDFWSAMKTYGFARFNLQFRDSQDGIDIPPEILDLLLNNQDAKKQKISPS